MRAAGLALVAAGVLIVVVAVLISPSPTSSYELGQDLGTTGTLDGSRVRISAYAGAVHSYDAANDTTFLSTSVCSHSVCGPLVPIRGDHRGSILQGPLLLRPVDDELRLVPVTTPREAGEPSFALGARDELNAFSSSFEPVPIWPPFLARVLGVALAAAGAGIAARRVWWAALPGALGWLPSLLVAKHASWIILVQIVGVPVTFIALVTALAQWGLQRRGWIAGGIALAGAAALATGFVALGYFPGDGGD